MSEAKSIEHPQSEAVPASSIGSPAPRQGDGDAEGGSRPAATTTVSAKLDSAALEALTVIADGLGLYKEGKNGQQPEVNRSAVIAAAVQLTAAAVLDSRYASEVQQQLQKRMAKNQVQLAETVPDVDRKTLAEIRDLLSSIDESYRNLRWEVNRVGVNMNQIAHVANWMKQQGQVSPLPEEAFAAVDRKLTDIDRRMRQLAQRDLDLKALR